MDESGAVTIDTFELPTACLCKAIFGLDIETRRGIPVICRESSKSIQDRPTITFDESIGNLKSSLLQKKASKIEPCEDNEEFCSGNYYDNTDYPWDEIDALLRRHHLYNDTEYFKDLLDSPESKSCRQLTQIDTGKNFS